MAKSYIHELGDRMSNGFTADNLPKHIKEIAPIMYNDGSNNFNSIQGALNGKAESSHAHGNIKNGGTLQTDDITIASGDKLVVTDASDSNKVARASLTFDGATTDQMLSKKGEWNDTIAKARAVVDYGSPSKAIEIGWGGASVTSPTYFAVYTDSANGYNKAIKDCRRETVRKLINGTSVGSAAVPVFINADGETQVCTDDFVHDGDVTSTYSSTGTAPVNGTAVAAAIGGLDVSSVGGDGKYISAISETDGKISATATTMDTTPTANSTKAVTSGGIKTVLDGKQDSLPTSGTASSTYAINISGNAGSATKATQDSDGHAINATYFKSSGNVTLVSGTATKIGTQNGTDVKLTLPTIPAAANNGALQLQLNGGTATSKFTANQSGNSTLAFSTGSTAGTFKVDSTEIAIAGFTKVESSSTNGNIKINGTETAVYTHPTTAGNKHIPSGGSSGQFLGYDSAGTAKWVSNPNTDTKQNITLATTTKAFITGVSTTPTSTAQALTGLADTGVYLTTTAGELNATQYKVNEHCTMKYNSTKSSLDFTFS